MLRAVIRGGIYVRVADPAWEDPLDGRYARDAGGRWNVPGSFSVVYLNGDERVARANLLQRFEGLPYGPEDLEPAQAPVLVSTIVSDDRYADVVSDAGCVVAGLPESYPMDASGRSVSWDVCQSVGQAAWDVGLAGIACRSAAEGAPRDGEELAWFSREARLTALLVRPFEDWF